MIFIIGDGQHSIVVRETILASDFDRRNTPSTRHFIAVGNNKTRMAEVNSRPGTKYATIIHPYSWISPSATIGEGSIVMAGAVIQAHAVIGKHCIVNTEASCDHHAIIEDYAHIAPGAHLCGNVHVGEGALVGVGVGIEPGVKIPPWSIVKRIPYVIEPVSGHTTV